MYVIIEQKSWADYIQNVAWTFMFQGLWQNWQSFLFGTILPMQSSQSLLFQRIGRLPKHWPNSALLQERDFSGTWQKYHQQRIPETLHLVTTSTFKEHKRVKEDGSAILEDLTKKIIGKILSQKISEAKMARTFLALLTLATSILVTQAQVPLLTRLKF